MMGSTASAALERFGANLAVQSAFFATETMDLLNRYLPCYVMSAVRCVVGTAAFSCGLMPTPSVVRASLQGALQILRL